MTAEGWLEVAEDTIRAAEYCFLITVSGSGRANARLMHPFKPGEDLTIWFGVSPRSRKVREIEANNQVTVTYLNAREHGYVALQGKAQVERDLDARSQHWREEWARFWPAGPEDEDYVVVKFVPTRIELMNIIRKVVPKPRTQPAILVRVEDSWVIPDDEYS